jgi:glycosyl hydrolase family 26
MLAEKAHRGPEPAREGVIMSQRRLVWTGSCVGALTLGLLVVTGITAPDGERAVARASTPPSGDGPTGDTAVGAFVGSGAAGVQRLGKLADWLGGDSAALRVGHSYLPGDVWANIEGKPDFLRPWARWRKAEKDRLLVLNVPMLAHNEAHLPDAQVSRLLQDGADGRFDAHYRALAEHLVQLGIPDTTLVLGWEMNGTTYSGRCAPNPRAWKAYFRRIVTTMRAVPGADFRFDFAPSRGRDAIPWTQCYPGDDYVDIIGMDSYDQPPGVSFTEQVNEPYGLQAQVDFAKAHGKPVSYPEWGLFREGDNPDYIRQMLHWIQAHDPVYQTITDYCPHGVWSCAANPKSSEIFRKIFDERPSDSGRPTPAPAPTRPAEPGQPGDGQDSDQFCIHLGDWVEKFTGGPVCIDKPSFDWDFTFWD